MLKKKNNEGLLTFTVYKSLICKNYTCKNLLKIHFVIVNCINKRCTKCGFKTI